MRKCWILVAFFSIAAQAADLPAGHEELEVVTAIQSGNPQQAVNLADGIIARYTTQYPDASQHYYCARSNAEVLADMVTAATLKQQAKALMGNEWCDAHFFKGFALIDLHRPDLAQVELRTATEMAPYNAHYLNEYAEFFKASHDWQKAYDLFQRAYDVASFEDQAHRNAIQARSLRGMGFTEIEMGKLDEAERFDRQALILEPGSAVTLGELQYIAGKRAQKP